MKVNKALLFFCEAYFLPFPPQSNSRAFLLVEIMKTKNLVHGVGISRRSVDLIITEKTVNPSHDVALKIIKLVEDN